MNDLPEKLKHDAVAEALLDVRFDCLEGSRVPEVVLSKLTQFERWKQFNVVRTPFADFPFQARMQDPNLKAAALLELHDPNGRIVVKVGTHVLSFHRLAPYPGWDTFRSDLFAVLDYMFAELVGMNVTRLGFRYINLFRSEPHGVNGILDLAIGVSIADQPIDGAFNLNFEVHRGATHRAIVKMASRDFIQPAPPAEVSVAVDVDVFTPPNWQTTTLANAKEWVEDAHTLEKEQFFRLFTKEMRGRLVAR